MLVRLAARRSLVQMTPFDLVLLLVMATQQGLLGSDFSVTNTFLVIATLTGLDVLLAFLTHGSQALDR